MNILHDELDGNISQHKFLQHQHHPLPQKQISLKKYFRVCNCCQKLVFINHNSNDGDQSQHREFQPYEEPSKSLTKIIEDALDDRYAELDNFINKWSSLFFSNQCRYRRSLIVLMDKFAQSFQKFQSDVHWVVNNEFFKYLVFTSQESFKVVLIQKYKEFIALKFHLIKDYMGSFEMDCLNSQEFNQIYELRLNSGLVDSYIEEMVRNKNNTKPQSRVQVKKENKHKKKKKCKANLNAELQNKAEPEEKERINQTITMLRVLKINDQQRKCCNLSQLWLRSITLNQG